MAVSEQGNQDYYFHDKKQEQEDEQLQNQSNGYYSHVDLQGQVHPQTEFNNINPQVVNPTGFTTMTGNRLIYQDHHVNHGSKQDQDQNQDGWNNAGGIVIDEASGIIYFNRHEGTPLGLNLRMSISVVNQIRLPSSQPNHKLKACNIPANLLKIGFSEWVSKRPQDLTVKFYYRSKKLVWEFLCGPLKKKIAIRWSQISAINKFVDKNKTSCLEIELKEQPELFDEVNYQAKKHTVWGTAKFDFTKGEATTWRRHTLVFPPGVLDDPFKNLMECDNRLSMLSRQPFPYHNSPIFQNKILDFSCNRSINGCPSIVPNIDHQEIYGPYLPTLVQPIRSLVGHSSSNIPTPDCNPNGERDDILPNHEMDSRIPDEQQELQKMDFKKVSEFTNKETNFSVDPTCEPLKLSDEMKSNANGNNVIVSKEPNSCLPVDATIGIDEWDLHQINNGVDGVDQLGHDDGEIDVFQKFIRSNMSWD